MAAALVARPRPATRSPAPVQAASTEADARFPRTVRKAYKAITSATEETSLVRIPWGPRFSMVFVPRGAAGIVGGRLRVYAVLESDQVSIFDVAIASAADAIPFVGEIGCDSFLVAATLGAPLPAGGKQVESYVYACTYAGALG